jgi:hypothetical protein
MATKAVKFNIDGADEVDSGGNGFYDGPVPPKGMYRVSLGLVRLRRSSKTKEPMFEVLVRVDEPQSSDKAKYNGYGLWNYPMITMDGAPRTNGFLDAFGFSRKAVWKSASGGIKIDDSSKDDSKRILGDVVKIGTKTVNLEGEMAARVTTRFEKGKDGNDDRLNISRWMSLSDADGADDEDEWDESPEDDVDEELDDEVEVGEDEAEEAEEDDAEPEDDEEPWTEENLPEYAASAVEEGEFATPRDFYKSVAVDYGVRVLKRHTEDDLITLILEAQEADAGEESEEGEPPF